jgi:hypothetical protein
LGRFGNVKRKICSHPRFGGETIKDLGQRAKAGAEFLIPRGYSLLKGGENMKKLVKPAAKESKNVQAYTNESGCGSKSNAKNCGIC